MPGGGETLGYAGYPPFLLHIQKLPGVGVGAQDRTRRDCDKGALVSTPGPSQQTNSTRREHCKVSCFAGNLPQAWSLSTGTITAGIVLLLGGDSFPSSGTGFLSSIDRASPGPEWPCLSHPSPGASGRIPQGTACEGRVKASARSSRASGTRGTSQVCAHRLTLDPGPLSSPPLL